MDILPPDPRTVSKWDLRRLYNEGEIKKLAKQNGFNVKREVFKPGVVSPRIPSGSQSVGTYYFHRDTGVLVARFHHYESPEGVIIGVFDPKFLLIDHVEFHLPKRGTPEPDRIGNVEINRILRKTGIRAQITYYYHLTERAKKVWKEQVTNRLVKWGLKEGRG